jgi:hypothetical protein
MAFFMTLALLGGLNLSAGLVEPHLANNIKLPVNKPLSNLVPENKMSRRGVMAFGFSSIFLLGVAEDAHAFPNKISDKYDDRPKRRGSMVRCCNEHWSWLEQFFRKCESDDKFL